ncbi:hypothetical protein [Kitasatospora cheerisanensis]|nr:hypothetical protein [Kitasatospora cheerisanensis]
MENDTGMNTFQRLALRVHGADVDFAEGAYQDILADAVRMVGGADPRVFHRLPGADACADDYYLLAAPDQAALLRDEFGLRIEVRGPQGLSVHPDA